MCVAIHLSLLEWFWIFYLTRLVLLTTVLNVILKSVGSSLFLFKEIKLAIVLLDLGLGLEV